MYVEIVKLFYNQTFLWTYLHHLLCINSDDCLGRDRTNDYLI